MIVAMKSFAVAFGMTARQLLQQQQIPFGMTTKKGNSKTRNTTATSAATANGKSNGTAIGTTRLC
jgi:hypothetical protein